MTDGVAGISFGQSVDLLSDAVKGAKMEQEQIANNIANVDTPNFRRSTTSFKDALAATLGTPASTDELPLETNDDRQFALNDDTGSQPFDPQAHVDDSDQMRVDKSNVDIDQEMGQLAANSSYQQTMSQLLSEQYKSLREAIQGQPQ